MTEMRTLEDREPLFLKIEATPEAFFQRCRDLRPAFIAEVFQRFTARILDVVPPRYAADLPRCTRDSPPWCWSMGRGWRPWRGA